MGPGWAHQAQAAMGTTEEVAARIARAGLEGDGVASPLFELLWKRDLLSDSSLALRIPDTVIFKYNAPSLWYFTSVDGTIKRKGKAKVNNEHIAKEFLRRPSASGIAAYYVTTVPDTEEDVPGEGDGCVGTKTTIEYLDRDGLQDFLFSCQRERSDGILQRFIEPKGGCNNMVRALWSPKVCLLERRVNHLRVSDTRYDIYERAVTFEGADCHSQVTPVRGPALVTKVHEIADSIVQHVAGVTNDRIRISRLALNFKVDDRDRLWLLFASSVRLRDELIRGPSAGQPDVTSLTRQGLSNTPLEANTVLQVPDHVRRARTISYTCPVTLQRTCRCPTCDEKVEAGNLFEVCYKVLVAYEERQAAKRQQLRRPPPEAGGASQRAGADAEVPEVLQKLHPRLTPEEYSRYRHDVAFLYKAAAVCETCFLRFSRPQLGVAPMVVAVEATARLVADGKLADVCDPDAVLAEPPLAGMQNLAPERLRRRRDTTLQRIGERQAEEEELWDEQAREQAKQMVRRTRSCPKLPSWTSHATTTWAPPAPVLACRPRPPQGSAPLWGAVRASRVPDFAAAPPPRARRVVPPLRGEPYLREVQDFAARYAGRAGEVLGPAAYGAALRAACRLPPSSSTGALGGKAPGYAPGEAVQLDPEPIGGRRRTPERRRGGRSRSSERGLRLEATEESDGEGDVLEEESEGDPIVAELWGKWPPTCRSGQEARSSTPTTRPPSQGEPAFSGPSSYACSRPSTRTSSRGKSPANAPAGQQLALQHARAARPRSSPQAGARAQVVQHQRPSSSPSPGSKPGLGRPPSLRAAAGEAGAPSQRRKTPPERGRGPAGPAALAAAA